MAHLLDNIFWHSLSESQSQFAIGEGKARRYALGFSPILGFAEPWNPDFDALRPYCQSNEQFYCGDWSGAISTAWQQHWRIDKEASMYRMVWQGELPLEDTLFSYQPLTTQDAEQALALAQLTNPGPFGLRTIELGLYLGCFEAGRLIAMAGERSFAHPYREISGVCTHPDFQGRGLAGRLMRQIIRHQLQAQEIPFLHVMSHNKLAHELYLKMGFVDYCETPVRVITRL
ncbi:GNAT family N-acetyltransferase [Undibacterium fentianense]|uniref:GNAT family N-acetyltransferase n=1 Tax=Undibacterium fentianense TaxID=2828728 RepID=A0A941IHV5_9BURK|nr:GNAT family N-acetyltransferase [Undibacterium fentianense]MBR7801345.1 GNAT family N-acetyltransferase [Undibacterium fentianense]